MTTLYFWWCIFNFAYYILPYYINCCKNASFPFFARNSICLIVHANEQPLWPSYPSWDIFFIMSETIGLFENMNDWSLNVLIKCHASAEVIAWCAFWSMKRLFSSEMVLLNSALVMLMSWTWVIFVSVTYFTSVCWL